MENGCLESCVTQPAGQPSAKDVCVFLGEYAGWLFSCGSTVIRIEKNVQRIACAFGMEVNLSILPHHIHITVKEPSQSEYFTTVVTVNDCGISFNIITLLSRLSWDIADKEISFHETKQLFERIIKQTGAVNKWLLPVLVGLANASFCRLFGGDPVSMAIIFISTYIGFSLKQYLSGRKIDFRLVVTGCAFISSMLASTDIIFSLGSTPGLTISTSVLYLVPGIPFINAFCDILDKHYVCSFGRLMNAVVITACLSLGILITMLLTHQGMF